MDGLNAGIILFTYCLIAFSLAYLLIRYLRKSAKQLERRIRKLLKLSMRADEEEDELFGNGSPFRIPCVGKSEGKMDVFSVPFLV